MSRAGLSAVGHVDSLATTVCDGTCTNTFWPLMPDAWKNGRPGSRPETRQYPRDGRGHRLGHRHQQARYVRRHAVEIVLGHDPALVQDEEPVGVGLPEQLGHGPLVVRPADLKAEDVALGAWQRPGGPGSPRDPGRADQLAVVLESCPGGPPVLALLPPLPGP